jgi:DNA polymerase elongation subunit (family B)
LDKTKIIFQFYDSEIELIRDFFQTVHRCQPDFCEGWNSSGFDISYLIARVQVLGYAPEDIGFNSPLYSRERKKYKPNEIPTKYKSWEYLSKRMVNLMIMRADTEKARQQRLKLEF